MKQTLLYLGIPGAILASLLAIGTLTDMAPWAAKAKVQELAQLSLYDLLATKEERITQLQQIPTAPAFVLQEIAKLCTEVAKIRIYLNEPESWVCR